MSDEVGGLVGKHPAEEDAGDWRPCSRVKDSGFRPASALTGGIHITEFSESHVNPTPLLLEESDILLEQYLSPGKLQLLTGVDDLRTVEFLELKVDSRETSLGNFGSLLPNLVELKLSGSCIACVRDLGSSLRSLKVLWMTRCGLTELDGISAMSDLRELYLEYNEISDISPLSMLEHLEVLDLEGNNIDDITQIQYLSFCPKLQKLALDGNPICVCPTPTHDKPGYDFREMIKKLLPNLHVLDDERLDDNSSSSVRHHVFDEDWAYLEELHDDALLHDEFPQKQDECMVPGDRPLTAALRPATAYRPGSSLRPSSGFRPSSAAQRPSTIGGSSVSPAHSATPVSNRPASCDAAEGLESVSELTMGGVICGNPSKALRQRRKGGSGSKEDIDTRLSKLLQKGAPFIPSEGRDDEPAVVDEGEMSSIIEELRSWRLEHEKRIQLILKSKEAQILVVDHDNNEDLDDFGNEDDAEVENDPDNNQVHALDNYVYRPPSMRRHIAELRRRAETPQAGLAAKKGVNSEERVQENSPEEGSSLNNSADTVDLYPNRVGYDQSFDAEGNSLDTEEKAPSLSSLSGQLTHQSSTLKQDLSIETDKLLHQRSASKNQREGALAPLRAPSPAVVHILNKNLTESAPVHQKKLRVGPTGLPLPSQLQQPVMRNNIAVLQTRSGLIKCRPGTSPTNIVLLPSQPRIQRHLPESPPLISNPPANF